jgi:hypothetical protein
MRPLWLILYSDKSTTTDDIEESQEVHKLPKDEGELKHSRQQYEAQVEAVTRQALLIVSHRGASRILVRFHPPPMLMCELNNLGAEFTLTTVDPDQLSMPIPNQDDAVTPTSRHPPPHTWTPYMPLPPISPPGGEGHNVPELDDTPQEFINPFDLPPSSPIDKSKIDCFVLQ